MVGGGSHSALAIGKRQKAERRIVANKNTDLGLEGIGQGERRGTGDESIADEPRNTVCERHERTKRNETKRSEAKGGSQI